MFFDGDIVIVFDGRRFGIEKLSENLGDRTEMGDLVSPEFHIAMAINLIRHSHVMLCACEHTCVHTYVHAHMWR